MAINVFNHLWKLSADNYPKVSGRKIKVVFDKYNLSVKGKTTTCEVTAHLDIRGGFADFEMIDSDFTSKLITKLEEPFTVTGVAMCSDDDNFDKNTGRLIATAKAENKAYEKAGNLLLWLRDELESKIGIINNTLTRMFSYHSHNSFCIKKEFKEEDK